MNARVPMTASEDTARRWRDVRNVLAVRLDNLGDVLMTTPALSAIRHSLPGARITLLTSAAGAMAARHIPEIDEALIFQAPWIKAGAANGGFDGRGTQRMVRRLAACRFDAAVIFTVCTQSALPAAMLCMLAGIPLRLAYCRENPYALLTDWVADQEVVADGMRHEVLRQLALVEHVGWRAPTDRLRFQVPMDDAVRLQERTLLAGLDPRQPYVVVHPGASAPSRRYPAARFGVAAQAVAEESGAQVVFTGAASERTLIEEAQAVMTVPSLAFAGDLSLGELAALIAGAKVLIANNSGPAHIAAAVNTPVVDVYALTNPQHTPWGVPSRVLFRDVPCRNCLKSVCPEGHHQCLLGVEPHDVAGAALDLMGLAPLVMPAANVALERSPELRLPVENRLGRENRGSRDSGRRGRTAVVLPVKLLD